MTLYLKAAGGNWTSASTWSATSAAGVDNAGPPTNADDCIAELASGNLTISAASAGKSFSTTAGTGTWAGSLTHNNFVLTLSGSLTLNSSMTYTLATIGSSTFLTFNANATITTGGKAMPSISQASSAVITLGDNFSFTAEKGLFWNIFSGSINLNGKTISGNSAINRVLFKSNTVGTGATITVNSGTFANADFQDIIFSSASNVDLSAITGKSGDCGGNSIIGGGTNLTFTTAETQTSTGTTSFTSSTHGWTSRVPLPQDDVVINNAFVASQTITFDMPRVGRSITFAGCTGTPTLDIVTAISIFGSANFTGVATGVAGISGVSYFGRGSHTITSAGAFFAGHAMTINSAGGSYTLVDAYSSNAGAISHLLGTFNSNSVTVTANAFISNVSTVRSLILGTSTWVLSNSPTVWAVTYTNLIVSAASSTIMFTSTNANAITFNGGSNPWGTITRTSAGASRGTFTIQGNNTITTLNVSNASASTTLIFSSGSNNAITNFNVFGTTGKVLTLVGSSVASTFTLTFPASVISTDYCFIRDSIATGGGSYYAGANSTDGLNNTGWTFTDPPTGGGAAVNLPLLFVG